MRLTADRKLIALALTISIGSGGCSLAPASSARTRNAPATASPGRLGVSVQPDSCIGDVVPVYVSVANGTEDARTILPTQIFALNDVGERIAPMPSAEAARQAGNAMELRTAIQAGALAGAGGAVASAASAMAPSSGLSSELSFNAPNGSTLVGAGFAAESGVMNGAGTGQSTADQLASAEVDAVSLQPQEINQKVVSGFVFFPKGKYQQLEIVLVKRDGGTETIRQPWH